MIGRLLDRVKPDYVQYDCKGHVGWAGYPTKVGWPRPGIKKDSLAVWRKMTRERGIGLYIHYSGVWDTQAVPDHPDWARIDAQGKRDPNATSVFGGYMDGLLIPQLKEVTSAYDSGRRVGGRRMLGGPVRLLPGRAGSLEKGDRLGRAQGQTEPALAGVEDVPPEGLRDLPRPLGRRPARLQARASRSPQLDVHDASRPSRSRPSWIFSRGIIRPSLSVDRARVEARYLASTGMPWDLMAWGFDKGQDLGLDDQAGRSSSMQEAAVVLMQGGGFQVYHTPTRSGFIVPRPSSTSSARWPTSAGPGRP